MELFELSIRPAVEGLREKQFSCLELVKNCLARIQKVDPKLRAFLTVCDKKALQEAKEFDRLLIKGNDIFKSRPLLGIPYSAKDVFCTEDIQTTASSKILKNYLPQYSATAIKKLNQAGAILLGKTNNDAFGFGSSTENSDFQVTRNPWNLKKVPGGSSGGSAAAVASGMGLFSLAEDTGGSIRQPSCFCSVTGIKVTYGRVSRYGAIAYGSSLDTVGTMAKNVSDVAITLQAIAGKDEKDATTLKALVPDYFEGLTRPARGLRIGLPKEYFAAGIAKDVKNLVLEAGQVLARIGFKIEEISLPHTKYAIPAYYLAAISEVSANLARYDGVRYGETRDYFGPEVKRRIMLGTYALSAGYYEAFYQKVMRVRTLIKKDFDYAFKKVDAILAPVSPFPPFDIGEKTDNPLAMWLADVYTVTINPAGIPALALPCGFTKDRLPIGMQIIGPQLGEELILRVGYAYQQATEWHKRSPNL